MSEDKIKKILEKVRTKYQHKEIHIEESRELISFMVAEELYAFDTSSVREIIKPRAIFSVPATPAYIKGVINLRGEVIAIVDFRMFLGLPKIDAEKTSRVIVSGGDIRLGFSVDSIVDIIHIPVSQIQPPLATIDKINVDYFEGEVLMEDKLLSILNIDKIMNSEEILDPGDS
jgi:purine-binding chemotaxis protein CheW